MVSALGIAADSPQRSEDYERKARPRCQYNFCDKEIRCATRQRPTEKQKKIPILRLGFSL